jgi:hypothetical protein
VFQVIEKRKLTRSVDPLWPPQRGVGLQEPNLGKTNLRVSLAHSFGICFCALSRGLVSLLLTLTRLVVVFIFVNFSFALFIPPLGDFQFIFVFHQTHMNVNMINVT